MLSQHQPSSKETRMGGFPIIDVKGRGDNGSKDGKEGKTQLLNMIDVSGNPDFVEEVQETFEGWVRLMERMPEYKGTSKPKLREALKKALETAHFENAAALATIDFAEILRPLLKQSVELEHLIDSKNDLNSKVQKLLLDKQIDALRTLYAIQNS